MKLFAYSLAVIFCWAVWASLGWLIFTTPHGGHTLDWIFYSLGTILVLWLSKEAIFFFSVAAFGYLMKFLFWLKGN